MTFQTIALRVLLRRASLAAEASNTEVALRLCSVAGEEDRDEASLAASLASFGVPDSAAWEILREVKGMVREVKERSAA